MASTLPVWAGATPDTIAIGDTGTYMHLKWMLTYEFVLQGIIVPVAKVDGQLGLTKLLVRRKDVIEAHPSKQDEAASIGTNLYKCADVLKKLKIHQNALKTLREHSYLFFKKRMCGGDRRSLTITTDELIAFDEIYVSGALIAEDLGLNSAHLTLKLRSMGVRCIIRHLGGCNGSVFLREDVEKPLEDLFGIDYRLIASKLGSVAA